jgi:excisionase family DNA binding protein
MSRKNRAQIGHTGAPKVANITAARTSETTRKNPFAGELEAALAEYGPSVTIPDAAVLVGVSERTLRRAVASGELRQYKFGRSRTYRVRTEDLFNLLVAA